MNTQQALFYRPPDIRRFIWFIVVFQRLCSQHCCYNFYIPIIPLAHTHTHTFGYSQCISFVREKKNRASNLIKFVRVQRVILFRDSILNCSIAVCPLSFLECNAPLPKIKLNIRATGVAGIVAWKQKQKRNPRMKPVSTYKIAFSLFWSTNTTCLSHFQLVFWWKFSSVVWSYFVYAFRNLYCIETSSS